MTVTFFDKYGLFDLSLHLKKDVDLKKIEAKVEKLLDKYIDWDREE